MKLNRITLFNVLLPCLLCLAFSAPSRGQTNASVVVADAAGKKAAAVVVVKKSPALTFWLDRVPGFDTLLLGIPLWQYLASVIYICLAFLAARLFDWIAAAQVSRFTARTENKADDMVIELLRRPVRMLALVVLLQMGLSLFLWPAWLERWLQKGFYLLLAFSVTYVCLKLVDLGANYWRARRNAITGTVDKNFNELLIPMVSKVVKVFVVIMALLVTLQNLGFNVTTLLAGVGVGGLALGLAAQDTVANLFGAAAVFMDKPFKIGDFVRLPEIEGSIEEMGLRSTRIRNPDGHLITVPNKTMGNATITNITMRPNIKTVMNIGITYDAPAEKVEEAGRILNEVYGGHPMTHDLLVGFNVFGESALNFMVIHWWKGLDYKEYLAGLQELNLTVKRRFDAAGLEFAFPSRTVYLKQEEDWRVNLPAAGTEAVQRPA